VSLSGALNGCFSRSSPFLVLAAHQGASSSIGIRLVRHFCALGLEAFSVYVLDYYSAAALSKAIGLLSAADAGLGLPPQIIAGLPAPERRTATH
jgi:hypothetical protein